MSVSFHPVWDLAPEGAQQIGERSGESPSDPGALVAVLKASSGSMVAYMSGCIMHLSRNTRLGPWQLSH